MIVCAGEVESFKWATPIGIGLINSAINLTNILSKNPTNELVFVGTCGLYKDGKILEIYESQTAVNYEISGLLDLAYSPLKIPNVSCETLVTNSSNFITTDKTTAHKFSQIGLFMENMELFAVLEVAKFFGIPARGILCATNFCDEFAHTNFIKNHKQAKMNLEKYIKEREII